jgi:xanthine dehydrogenase molybdenum-binding subunit
MLGLCRDEWQVSAARRLPFVRTVPGAERRRGVDRRLHEQSDERRDARLWHEPGHFAIEGVMDILAEKIGVDGWEIRWRNILNPGDQFATGQLMRESVRGLRESLNAVKDIYRSEKFAGVSCGIKSTGIGNGTTEEGRVVIRVIAGDQVQILNGYTEMGQGLYTATMQAVCEETGLPDSIMNVLWDKELGAICGETWASRATTLSCAAAQKAAQKLARTSRRTHLASSPAASTWATSSTASPPSRGRQRPRRIRRRTLPSATRLRSSSSMRRGISSGSWRHTTWGARLTRASAPSRWRGGVHMGLGYALSENFTSTNGRPDSLKMRDFGLVPAKQMPEVDIILIEVPDEYGGYGAKGVGEIGCVATASAVAAALYSYDGKRRFTLPMDDAPAALPLLPKSPPSLDIILIPPTLKGAHTE